MNTNKTMIAAGGLAMALAMGAGAGAGIGVAEAAAPMGAVGVTKALATTGDTAGVQQVDYYRGRRGGYYGRPYYGYRPYRPYWGPPVVYRPAPYYYAPYYAPPVYYYPY